MRILLVFPPSFLSAFPLPGQTVSFLVSVFQRSNVLDICLLSFLLDFVSEFDLRGVIRVFMSR